FAPVRNYLSLWPALILLVAGRALTGLYPGYGLHPAEELRRQTVTTGLLVVIVLAGGSLFRFSGDYSRIVLSLTALLIVFLLPVARGAAKVMLARHGSYGAPIWIVGDAQRASQLAEVLNSNRTFGLHVVGHGQGVPVGRTGLR